MSETEPKRRQFTVQMGAIVLALMIGVGLAAAAFVPVPMTVRDDREQADVVFSVNRRWIPSPDGCVELSWKAENISAIFLDDLGTVGERSTEVCVSEDTTFVLRVDFASNITQEYRLEVLVLQHQPLVWILVVVMVGLVFSAVTPARVAAPILRATQLGLTWIVITAVVLEVGFRLWVYTMGTERERILYLGSTAEIASSNHTYIEMPYLNYGLSPLADDVNVFGFRGEEISLEKPGGVYRIAAMGGSTTYGDGLEWDEAWPAQLERILTDEYGYNVEVINAGVPSYTSWHTLINFQFRVVELDPDLIIVYHGANDNVIVTHFSQDCYRGENANLGIPHVYSWNKDPVQMSPSAFWRFFELQLDLIPDPSTLDLDTSFFKAIGCDNNRDESVNPPTYYDRNLRFLVSSAQIMDVDVMLSTIKTGHINGADYRESNDRTLMSEVAVNDVMRNIVEEVDGVYFVDLAEDMPYSRDYFQVDNSHQTALGTEVQASLYAEYIDEQELIPR